MLGRVVHVGERAGQMNRQSPGMAFPRRPSWAPGPGVGFSLSQSVQVGIFKHSLNVKFLRHRVVPLDVLLSQHSF